MFGELVALNFDCMGSPSIVLKDGGSQLTSGWGFGWHPNDDYAASIVKDGMASDSFEVYCTIDDHREKGMEGQIIIE